MAEEISFTLPKEFIKPLYLRLIPMCILISLSPVILASSIGVTWTVVAIVLLMTLLPGLYYYTIQYKYVFVSSSALRGKSYFLKKTVVIPWSNAVTLKKKNTEEGIDGYLLTTSESKDALFLPEAIALHRDFKEAVARYAPSNHVLLALHKAP